METNETSEDDRDFYAAFGAALAFLDEMLEQDIRVDAAVSGMITAAIAPIIRMEGPAAAREALLRCAADIDRAATLLRDQCGQDSSNVPSIDDVRGILKGGGDD